MIDGKQRLNDDQESLRTAIEGMLSQLWTSLPAIIISANYDKQTLTAQPTIMGKATDKNGNVANVKMPLLVDVPFQSFGGADFVVTMPNLEGSECLIVFSSRCIDGWWLNGGIQPQIDQRMHDLSDGMAIIGFNSQKRLITNYSTTEVEVRTFDGTTKIGLKAGTVTITAANTHITGTLQVDGAVTANSTLSTQGAITSAVSVTAPNVVGSTNVTFGGKSGIAHTHSGVTTGTSNTGAPN